MVLVSLLFELFDSYCFILVIDAFLFVFTLFNIYFYRE